MTRLASKKSSLLLAAVLFAKLASAQAAPWFDDPAAWSSPAASALQDETQLTATMAPQVATTTAPSTVTIPAGTRVLMVLKSPLHTTSGTAGSGLYLETLYPVVQGNRVVIPAHTQVQGVVEADKRPGHLNRVSEFRFRFTTLIFPNNFVAPIDGVLQSIPGAKNIRTHDKDGTLRGTNVEMVLQAPFSLEQSQVSANARYVRPSQALNDTQQVANADDSPKRRKHQRNSFGTINPFTILVPLD